VGGGLGVERRGDDFRVSQPAAAQPAYLSLDGSGNWTIAASAANLTVHVADATPGPFASPFKMAPTPAAIATTAGAKKTVLFHQL
jgi:hypothetical protein